MNIRTWLALGALSITISVACAHVEPGDPADIGGEGGDAHHASGGHNDGHAGEHSEGGLGGGGAGAVDPCCVLGAVCHVVGGGDPEVEECHQIGHENDRAECSAHFDRCHELCEGLNDEPEPHACTE
jgi:hypothetical protein